MPAPIGHENRNRDPAAARPGTVGRPTAPRGWMRDRRARALALCSMVAGAALLSACGSSGSPPDAAAAKSACQQVSAVLSDGPDPSADPVGYAEAQVVPL